MLIDHPPGNLARKTTIADPRRGFIHACRKDTYDANGNRTSATVGSSSSVYTPGAYNRLESVDDGTTVTVYGYDPEGNLVLRFVDADESGSLTTGDTEVTEYVWDHRNRLVSVTNYNTFGGDSTQQVGYAYDYLNRMISRTVDADGAGTTHSPATEYFVYDHDASTNWALKDLSTSKEGTIPFGADPSTDSGQIVLQLDENGSPTHRYLWGPAVDMLLADETVNSGADQTPGTADDVRWTLTDHQNSVRDILVYDDVAEEWIIENHITYRAFGEKAAQTGAVDCVFGFTGRFFDEFTDLQNNHQRWYDAVLAHWQSEDPIAFAAGDANLYRYCGNDPVNWIDPSGLAPDWLKKTSTGAAIGFLEFGRALSYPARWFGADFSSQDQRLDELWAKTISPRESYTKGATRMIASGAAVTSAGVVLGPKLVAGELIDTALEEATGVPMVISPGDAIQDFGKWGARRAARSATKAAETTVDFAVESRHFVSPRYGKYVPRADNYKHALDPTHVKAAKIEKAGGIVKINPKTGLPYDHLKETLEAMDGARDRLDLLKKYLSDPSISKELREAIESELSTLSRWLDRAEDILGK